jgi:hypothetical protein
MTVAERTERYKAEIHRQFLRETTPDDVIRQMWKAHEAQLRRNRRESRKNAKEFVKQY